MPRNRPRGCGRCLRNAMVFRNFRTPDGKALKASSVRGIAHAKRAERMPWPM
jgi:hypothetical protein